jgi:hypothetical protein
VIFGVAVVVVVVVVATLPWDIRPGTGMYGSYFKIEGAGGKILELLMLCRCFIKHG